MEQRLLRALELLNKPIGIAAAIIGFAIGIIITKLFQ